MGTQTIKVEKHVREKPKCHADNCCRVDLKCTSNVGCKHLYKLHHATVHTVLHIWHAEEQKRNRKIASTFFSPTVKFKVYSKGG